MNTLAEIYTKEDLEHWDISGETIMALIIIGILIILAFVVYFLAKRADPLKRPKGLLMLVEWAVEKLDSFSYDLMGDGFSNFSGLLLGIIPFLFLSFTVGIIGFPTPMTSLNVPLSLALVTFGLIHYTSMRYTHWKYFKRFVDPFPFFLPVNLLSMWSPLLSLSLRMFGNATAGWVMLSLLNYVLELASGSLFAWMGSGGYTTIWLVPIATPVLHAYFDLFSGFIQTLVFVTLTCLFVAQEKPEEEELQDKLALTQ